MANTQINCEELLAEIKEKYEIKGLESISSLVNAPANALTNVQEFAISLYSKKNNSDNYVAIIKGISAPGKLDVSMLDRVPGTPKGTGRLLLELVACYAVKLGYSLNLLASSGKKRKENAEKLYNFYNSVGLTRYGPEDIFYNNISNSVARYQVYSTSPETLRVKYKGGGRRRRKTRSKRSVRVSSPPKAA
jgi:hypothetical protein